MKCYHLDKDFWFKAAEYKRLSPVHFIYVSRSVSTEQKKWQDLKQRYVHASVCPSNRQAYISGGNKFVYFAEIHWPLTICYGLFQLFLSFKTHEFKHHVQSAYSKAKLLWQSAATNVSISVHTLLVDLYAQSTAKGDEYKAKLWSETLTKQIRLGNNFWTDKMQFVRGYFRHSSVYILQLENINMNVLHLAVTVTHN